MHILPEQTKKVGEYVLYFSDWGYHAFEVSQIFSNSPPGVTGGLPFLSLYHKLHSVLHSVDTECLLGF